MDKKEILAALGGIPEAVYDGIVAGYYAEAKVRLEQLKKCLDANDFDAAAREAHAVKGSAANLHLTAIRDTAKNLEAALKSGAAADVPPLLATLSSLIP